MKLLTVKEACEVLNVSQSTLLRMIQTKAIPVVVLRAGPRKHLYRFRPELLEKWVAAHTVEARGGSRKTTTQDQPTEPANESTEKF